MKPGDAKQVLRPGDLIRYLRHAGLGLSSQPGRLSPDNRYVGMLNQDECVLVIAVVMASTLRRDIANSSDGVLLDEALIVFNGCRLGWVSCYYDEFEVVS